VNYFPGEVTGKIAHVCGDSFWLIPNNLEFNDFASFLISTKEQHFMKQKLLATFLTATCLGMLLAAASTASAAVLVGDVFLNGYDGWLDKLSVVPAGGYPNWGILLTEDKCLSESSDGRVSTGASNSGNCKGLNLVNSTYAVPGNFNYHLKAELSTYDNDGFGLLFGYQNEDNYFRIAFRQQPNGNLGYAPGVSVQKVVGGTVTQLATSTAFIPQVTDVPFSVDVSVNNGSYAVSVNGTAIPALSGTESGSSLLTTYNTYGVHSWYQRYQDIVLPPATVLPDDLRYRGTEVRSVTISDAADVTIGTHSFSGAVSNWKALLMTNSAGSQGLTPSNTAAAAQMRGNFHLDFRNGTIQDDTNGNLNATAATTPNIDFIGPSVIINDTNSGAWADYEMKVRMGTADNDGIGLLVRASTDVNGNATAFYRINFDNEAMGTAGTRPPKGLSIQKFAGGTWSELFRDNQTTPVFVYTPGTPFDVKATVQGTAITVEVTQGANVYTYPIVYDTTNPILTGSVGFTNWGCGSQDAGVVFGRYGGVAGTPLLTVIPEPATIVLLGMSLLGLVAWARRRNRK
jgi:hypothetical protein